MRYCSNIYAIFLALLSQFCCAQEEESLLLKELRAKEINLDAIVALIMKSYPEGGGADLVEERDKYGNTGLLVSVYRDLLGNPNITKMLLDRGANVEVKNNDGNNVFHFVQTKQMFDLLKDKFGTDLAKQLVQRRNDKKLSPLHIAVTAGMARLLLNLLDKKDRLSAVNAVDEFGNTPIFYARSAGLAKYWISNGARLDIKNNKGETALMHILGLKKFEFVTISGIKIPEELHAFRKDVGRDRIKSDEEIKREVSLYLIELAFRKKITIDGTLYFDIQDDNGKTVMHAAINAKDSLVVRLLRDGDTDINIKDEKGQTPFDLALSLYETLRKKRRIRTIRLDIQKLRTIIALLRRG